MHKEEEFQKAFEGLVREAYKDLFELRGDDAWTLGKEDLIGYFRTSDKTSDVIGGRQAAVFKVFAALAGHGDVPAVTKSKSSGKSVRAAPSKANKGAPNVGATQAATKGGAPAKRDVALTVRIEINLPAGATQETYDAIFKSIKANLIHE